MKRGRRSKLQFGLSHEHIDTMATRANNMGIYTVESLVNGIYYFFEEDSCVIASKNGHMMMSIETAEQLAKELAEIIDDVREDRREHRKPMSSRSIGKMLERDFA